MSMDLKINKGNNPAYGFINSSWDLKKREEYPCKFKRNQSRMLSYPKLKPSKHNFDNYLKEKMSTVEDAATNLICDPYKKKKPHRPKNVSENINLPQIYQLTSPSNQKMVKDKISINPKRKENKQNSSDLTDNYIKHSLDYSTNIVTNANIPSYQNGESPLDLSLSKNQMVTYLTEVLDVQIPTTTPENKSKLHSRNNSEIYRNLIKGIGKLNFDSRVMKAGIAKFYTEAQTLTSKVKKNINRLIEKEDEAIRVNLKSYLYPENDKNFIYKNEFESSPYSENSIQAKSPRRNFDFLLSKVRGDNLYKFKRIINERLDNEYESSLRKFYQQYQEKVTRNLKHKYVNEVLDKALHLKHSLNLKYGAVLK